jgi:hypothetical protein
MRRYVIERDLPKIGLTIIRGGIVKSACKSAPTWTPWELTVSR